VKRIGSPLAGRIVEINVKQGDTIAAGDTLMTIESMKMEIPFEAEDAGVVAAVLVAVDDTVDEDQPVIELQ
jgi:biotin carboxyl carrier protein